jgi:hypothetical protein
LIEIADKLSGKLKQYALPFKILLADGGFGSGENYAYLEAAKIEGFISLPGSYHPLREGFNYDPERDVYVCRNGKFLYNHGIRMEKGFANHYYHARIKECGVCPFKKECCGTKRRQSLTFSVYRNYHQRMQERIESKEGKKMKRRRMATVEAVFGSLLNYYGMKRANMKGKQAAQKMMLNLLRVCIGFGPLVPTICTNCSLIYIIQKIRVKAFLFSNYLSFILSSFALCNTHGPLP